MLHPQGFAQSRVEVVEVERVGEFFFRPGENARERPANKSCERDRLALTFADVAQMHDRPHRLHGVCQDQACEGIPGGSPFDPGSAGRAAARRIRTGPCTRRPLMRTEHRLSALSPRA